MKPVRKVQQMTSKVKYYYIMRTEVFFPLPPVAKKEKCLMTGQQVGNLSRAKNIQASKIFAFKFNYLPNFLIE